MPPSSRSAQSMVNEILTFVSIDSSAATAAQRSTALAWINVAYREYLRGIWYDRQGLANLHNWSFLTETDDLSLTADASAVDCPVDFGGLSEDPVFQYGSGDKGGLKMLRKSGAFVRACQRDSETTSTPEFWALSQKDFVTASGSAFELLFSPTPDADLTVSLTYFVDPSDLTDSASIYPKGIMSCEQVIVQIAKESQEKTEGDVLGPESRKARRLMADLVLVDKQRYATDDIQTSYAEVDSGIS